VSGATRFLLWAVVILVVAYVLNINIASLITSVGHTIQQAHNQNAHP